MAQSVAPINILEVLDGMEFPASLLEMVEYAEDNDASEDVLDQIQGMPERIYNSIEDVNHYMNRLDLQPGEENIWSSAGEDDMGREPDAADDINVSSTHTLGSMS